MSDPHNVNGNPVGLHQSPVRATPDLPCCAEHAAPGRYGHRTALAVDTDGLTAWFLLVVAGMFESNFAVFLKQSHGMTWLWPTAAFTASAPISFALLTVA